MSIIKCKCGKSSTNFKSLSEKDFPNGFEEECCLSAPKEEAPQETVPEEEPKAEEAKPEAKPRRGPKPKNQVSAQ